VLSESCQVKKIAKGPASLPNFHTLVLDSQWASHHQLEVDISGFPNVKAHFKRMQELPSVKKLLAYEKEVNHHDHSVASAKDEAS
jgi:hypothetical protein